MSASNTLPPPSNVLPPQEHDGFLALLPVVERHARVTFRGLPPVHREEAVAEAVAAAFQAYVGLRQRGHDPVRDFPSIMATFATLYVKNDRHVGGQSSSKDVLSKKAQQRHGFIVESLPFSSRTSVEDLYGDVRGQRELDAYEERLQDNTRSPVPDQAAFRIDFAAFLRELMPRDHDLALFLSLGNSAKQAAAKFRLSPGRVTQLRVGWCQEWFARHGEQAPFEERLRRSKQAIA
jgi:hypothetical protein